MSAGGVEQKYPLARLRGSDREPDRES